MRTAIIGGGIAGLAAAYELEKARKTGAAVEYTLFEATGRLGGCLASEIVDGAVLERGPDSFLTEKPACAELCRELGLAAELTPSNDAGRKTYIVVRNRLIPLPDGLMFLVPTKLVPTAFTRLFSLSTKVRMGLELLLPPRPLDQDESVASLVERHFGRETVERLADPLLSGIFGGDSAQLSARTVLPRLVEMESEYGSLTLGMLAAHRKMRARAKAAASQNGGAAPRAHRAVFTALRGGMQQLVDAVTARLDPASIRLSTPVSGIARLANSWRVESDDTIEHYEAVIMASPAWAAGALLTRVDAALGKELSAIHYSSSITVNLVFDETQLGRLPDGFGFLVPAVEGRTMLACTFVHRKFLGRAPHGKVVLRAFLGGVNNEGLLTKPDDELVATVRRELSEILGPAVIPQAAQPEHTQVSRWSRSMAQYGVGHQERRERIAQRIAALPGLRLAGNAYDGIGISDCIRLGRQAAQELLESTR
ncbi:MAG: protoporphyrinogen oxidase [Terracidiphilus sp.]|jgi:oxygen-dependent protoporphyrinogen oxidase